MLLGLSYCIDHILYDASKLLTALSLSSEKHRSVIEIDTVVVVGDFLLSRQDSNMAAFEAGA